MRSLIATVLIGAAMSAVALGPSFAQSRTPALREEAPAAVREVLRDDRGVTTIRVRSAAGLPTWIIILVREELDRRMREAGQVPVPQNHSASDGEMNLWCGPDWFIWWVEDENGNPVTGTITVACGDTEVIVG